MFYFTNITHFMCENQSLSIPESNYELIGVLERLLERYCNVVGTVDNLDYNSRVDEFALETSFRIQEDVDRFFLKINEAG